MHSVESLYDNERMADDEDLMGICKDDRCEILEIHPAHLITTGFDPFYDTEFQRWNEESDDLTLPKGRHGQVLTDVILDHITQNKCKPLMEIYQAVTDDYGTCVKRTVNRRVAELLEQGVIQKIEIPTHVSFCGYVRADSKYLQSQDGIEYLIESLESFVPSNTSAFEYGDDE